MFLRSPGSSLKCHLLHAAFPDYPIETGNLPPNLHTECFSLTPALFPFIALMPGLVLLLYLSNVCLFQVDCKLHEGRDFVVVYSPLWGVENHA